MIIGILGKAGSGKDTAADFMVTQHGFVKVALADPLKRICREVFQFSEDQLWGPSEKRNEPDKRYPRGVITLRERDGNISEFPQYLTPRQALQQLGTEWGRNCYNNVWVDYMLRVAKTIMFGQEFKTHDKKNYDQRLGLYDWNESPMKSIRGVVVPDLRFENEVTAIRAAGGKVIRVLRGTETLTGTAGQHSSETEQDHLPESSFDFTLRNHGTIDELYLQVQHVIQAFQEEARLSQRETEFADMLGDIKERGDVLAIPAPATMLAVPDSYVDIPLLEPEVPLPDGSSVLPAETDGQSRLRGLLAQREEDIKAGRLREYDSGQADVPPFKRRK